MAKHGLFHMSLMMVIVAALLPEGAIASTYYYTGIIKALNIMSSANAAFEDELVFSDFTSAGACKKDSNGLVNLIIRDDERGKKQLSVLLSAKLAGQPVKVKVVDDRVDPYGRCYLDVLTLE